LYNNVLHLLRILYANTSTYKFAWAIDACVRDNKIEQRRVQEIKTYFDGVIEGDSVIADLAMIVANPNTETMLIRNIYEFLVDAVKKEAIPKVIN
jgi:negative elongation factor B